METRTITTIRELKAFAADVVREPVRSQGAHVLALTGDLGAGKTTFTQQLGEVLGVKEHIVSPTFMIMRNYATTHAVYTKLVHIDAYRIEDEGEAEVLRLDEVLRDQSALVCIEWPERIPAYIPGDATHITFTLGEGDARIITYQPHGN